MKSLGSAEGGNPLVRACARCWWYLCPQRAGVSGCKVVAWVLPALEHPLRWGLLASRMGQKKQKTGKKIDCKGENPV